MPIAHTLIIPGLFEPPDTASIPAAPLLDHVLAKGEIQQGPAISYENLLAGFFGLDADSQDIPTGALYANLNNLDAGEGQWACVAPVHLLVDRDRLILFPLESSRVDGEAICNMLSTHFSEDGHAFYSTEEGPWLMRLNEQRLVKTSSLDLVAGRSLDPFMPLGEDAGWLRSVMNECQMLLHQHEGSEGCNSLWIWGVGTLPVQSAQPLESEGKSLLLKALSSRSSGDAIIGEESIHVIEKCLQGRQYSDQNRWLKGVSETECLIRKLLDARGANRFDELILKDDNGLLLKYRSRMRFRFWQSGSFAKHIRKKEH